MRWVGEAEGGWTKDKPKTGAGEALLPSAGVDAALLGLLLLGVSRRPSGSAIAATSDRRTAQAGLVSCAPSHSATRSLRMQRCSSQHGRSVDPAGQTLPIE